MFQPCDCVSASLWAIVHGVLNITFMPSEPYSSTDQQNILAENRNSGPQDAMMLLLERLPKRKSSWFSDFMFALKKADAVEYTELVKLIDPVLAKQGT